jgi:single-stranded-DNA-specific exonuclease
LPEAYAIIHPKNPNGDYPFKELAGVGVAFKVATALLGEVPVELLDLVSIGTIADLVSLTGENRILVRAGIEQVKNGDRYGLDLLLNKAGIEKAKFNEESIGFGIGPRLNALGRLGDANPGVELLSTFDEEEAEKIAELVEATNDERKAIVQHMTNDALAMIDSLPPSPINILAKESWHEGVLGIVAGRIMQETGKPTICLTIMPDEGKAKGSARSIDALNIYDAIASVRELTTVFGGHHMAAGMTLPTENIDALRAGIEKYITDNSIDMTQGATLNIDEVVKVEDASTKFIEAVDKLAPFGTDFPKPIFEISHVTVDGVRAIGQDNAHLKFKITDGANQLDAIGFGFGKSANEFSLAPENSFVGKLSINEWNGNKKPQLMLEDFKVEGIQVFDSRGKNGMSHLPKENSLFLLFSDESRKILPVTTKDMQAVYTDDLKVSDTVENLVVVDVPKELTKLQQFIQDNDFSRIYILGITPDEAYLNGMGTRDQYARLFTFIKQYKESDVRYKLKAMANYLKIPEKLLIFMIQVFSELKFVTITDGLMKVVEHPENHPLTDSSLYQARLAQIKTEEFLLLSDMQTIKSWLQDQPKEGNL